MEQLKYKVFEVLSRTLSVEAFEQWLYGDPYVAEHITDDDLVLDLMNLDYRSKHIFSELEKVLRQYLDKEEYIVAVVEYNCLKYLETETKGAANTMVSNICQYHRWDDNFRLIGWFYSFSYCLDFAEEGIYAVEELLEELSQFSKAILIELQQADAKTRKRLLIENIEEPQGTDRSTDTQPKSQPREWYKFWRY